jgi:hypothetical protein
MKDAEPDYIRHPASCIQPASFSSVLERQELDRIASPVEEPFEIPL